MKNTLRTLIADLKCLDVPIEMLADRTDLYAVGLTSLSSVQILLEMEREFDISVPDSMLTYELFASIDSLAAAVAELQRAKGAPPAHEAGEADRARVEAVAVAAPATGR